MKPRYLVAIVLSALVLFYPLSMGPAYGRQLHLGSPTILQMKAFYAPVIWLGDAIPPVGAAMEWYLRFWA